MLEKITSPKDIKKLSVEDLHLLAKDIREEILSTVSKVGGHLGSSLGTVELTLALHYVFNSPVDKILWDVGHQCYTHKLITGRYEKFKTLRQFNGISGFINPEESEHDIFAVGHGSTSLSSAIGFATARDLRNENSEVVAVIGDASLGGGMALEALNYIGHVKKDLIIVLNDNEMSISPTIGALSRHLTNIVTDERYNKAREKLKHILEKLPTLGQPMIRAAKLFEESVKGLISTGIIFEELGYRYIGPIDGHNLDILINTFKKVKKWREPILIHTITTKGKGYDIAERNQVWSHGPGPFDLKTGEPKNKNKFSFSNVFGNAIIELAKEDDRVVAITAAMKEGTGLEKFAKIFPHRFFDVGMCEEHAVTFAAGLAKAGFRPVVAIYSTFLQRAYDQILHDVCMQNLPVVFAIDRAGVVGEDGKTHQGVFDISYLRSIPNIILLAPAHEVEFARMLKSAIRSTSPIAIRYPKESATNVPSVHRLTPIGIGKSEILSEGDDLLILALGTTVKEALKAGENLIKEGIETTIVNVRCVKPLDKGTIIPLVKLTKRVITIEDNILIGGFGSALLELLRENGINNVFVKSIGIPDEFVEHGKRKEILEKYDISYKGIQKAAHYLLKQKI